MPRLPSIVVLCLLSVWGCELDFDGYEWDFLDGLGNACAASEECKGDLACISGYCLPRDLQEEIEAIADGYIGTGNDFPYIKSAWAGVECESEDGPATAYFDVPRNGSQNDFYRLPFPNDIRRTADGLDLDGFPDPGSLAPGNLIGRVLQSAEDDLDGFATNATIHFRFSRPYDGASLGDRLMLVDIDATSPEWGREHGLAWVSTQGPVSRYICPDWLAIRSRHGVPLRPGTTYAAIVRGGVTAVDGSPFTRDSDLTALLSQSTPSDPALASAWSAYAPLRTWLAETNTSPETLLNVAVFTTQQPEALLPRLREVIRSSDPPALTDLTVCEEGVDSPCDDGTAQRACGPAHPDYIEVHGRIALPIFQEGSPPYLEPESGGGIPLNVDGRPEVTRIEPVCFAMTIPRNATMPAAGFPLMLYAHGTGGSFRSGLGFASELAAPGEDGVPAASLAIDLPQHGARRGGSEQPPEMLFYNFQNPRAARDNVMQGAADLMAVVHWARDLRLDAASSPTGKPLRIDASRLVLAAHSQGATHGSLMLPYEPDLSAAVLSGHGGDFSLSLLHKTRPVDIAGMLPKLLLDENSEGQLPSGAFHPALALLQTYFERVDPVNFARRLHREPLESDPGRHVFMIYGLDDHFSPEPTMEAYARAGGIPVVEPERVDLRTGSEKAPLVGNRVVHEIPRTVGLRQYAPDSGNDGHFVATHTDAGRRDVLRFLRQALAGAIPEIGE